MTYLQPRILVANHPDYSHAEPETFAFRLVTEDLLAVAAQRISGMVRRDMLTGDRKLVPGGRQALRELAQMMTVIVER